MVGNTKAVKMSISVKNGQEIHKIKGCTTGHHISKTWGGKEIRMGSNINNRQFNRDCYVQKRLYVNLTVTIYQNLLIM